MIYQLTVEQNGFLLILSLRYAIVTLFLINSWLLLRKDPHYALNRAISLSSFSFAMVTFCYAMIDTIAYFNRPFPLIILNILRDVYGIFLGLIFVFFYISAEIISSSWNILIQEKIRLIIVMGSYILFLLLFLPSDEVLADGTIGFHPIENIAWLIILIFFIVIYKKLFSVMHNVKEKRDQAISFIIAISTLLVAFLYFILVNLFVEAPSYIVLHGDNFLYTVAGFIFISFQIKKKN